MREDRIVLSDYDNKEKVAEDLLATPKCKNSLIFLILSTSNTNSPKAFWVILPWCVVANSSPKIAKLATVPAPVHFSCRMVERIPQLVSTKADRKKVMLWMIEKVENIAGQAVAHYLPNSRYSKAYCWWTTRNELLQLIGPSSKDGAVYIICKRPKGSSVLFHRK